MKKHIYFYSIKMIKYSVKKCESFGFAPSLEKGKELFPSEIQNLVLIDDDHSIPDVETYKDKECTFFVVLGKETTITSSELETSKDDLTMLEQMFHEDKEHFEEIRSCIDLYKNRGILDDKSLKASFCDFLIDLYPKLKDSTYKLTIYNLLRDEHISGIENLKEEYPLKYVDIETTTVVHTKPFDDVRILIDNDDKGLASSIYKNKQDPKKAISGDSIYLEAVSNGIFTVVRGKRSAGFNYENRLMNHDNLDLIAKNGIVCTPESMDKGSFGKLMKVFSACKSFNVMFIHPSLVSKPICVEYPCDQALPEYVVKSGEILAIAFRYMCVYFFGYKGVHDDSLKEYEYLF